MERKRVFLPAFRLDVHRAMWDLLADRPEILEVGALRELGFENGAFINDCPACSAVTSAIWMDDDVPHRFITNHHCQKYCPLKWGRKLYDTHQACTIQGAESWRELGWVDLWYENLDTYHLAVREGDLRNADRLREYCKEIARSIRDLPLKKEAEKLYTIIS